MIRPIRIENKKANPPPIFIKGVKNFSDIRVKLVELIGVDNFHCKSTTDRLKVMNLTTQTPTEH